MTPANRHFSELTLNVKTKCLRNFMKNTGFTVLSFDVNFQLNRNKKSFMARPDADKRYSDDNTVHNAVTDISFQLNNTKLYFPLATLYYTDY